jgi:hypothetical protein
LSALLACPFAVRRLLSLKRPIPRTGPAG